MMDLLEKLSNIERLRQEIESHGELSEEILRKIEYKFRLECNYHSNRIEGGTLTKPETRSIMIGNITVENKPLKDIREMQGHDEMMKEIFKIGKGKARLSEKRIKEIHKSVIVAETPEAEQEIGQWKKVNNYIYTYKGERFDFTPKEEVPEAIHDLLNWLNAGLDKIHQKTKGAPNPLLLAFEFHLRYVTIHPFSDGNGRTARLLSNLILVSLGYPPFWVSEGSEKEAYNKYLGDIQVYKGSPDLLYQFLSDLVERSLQITLSAINGKDIMDEHEWQKKLHLLKINFTDEDHIKTTRSGESTIEVYNQSIKPTIARLVPDLVSFDDLFIYKYQYIMTENYSNLIDKDLEQFNIFEQNLMPDTIQFKYALVGFKKSNENPFDLSLSLKWNFNEYFYELMLPTNENQSFIKKKYDVFYSEKEIAAIIKDCGEWLYNLLEINVLKK